MIEINLLPGSVKRTKRKMGGGLPSSPLSKVKLPPMDKYLLIAIAMWIVGIGGSVFMQLSYSAADKLATTTMLALQRDTADKRIQLTNARALGAKRDTIADKLTVIQALDGGRYDWAHILDEVSRAVPDYTWLVSITKGNGADPNVPSFKIEGRMGNAFALPKFISELEASPFISNVSLKDSQPIVENQKSVYSFVVEATYEEPSADLIQTEPLFGPDMQPDSTISALVTSKGPAKTDAASAAAAANEAAAATAKPAPTKGAGGAKQAAPPIRKQAAPPIKTPAAPPIKKPGAQAPAPGAKPAAKKVGN